MKTILTSILIGLITFNTFAENPNITPFEGTWTWQDGNKTFTVEIYAEYNDYFEDYRLRGNYKMEETIGGVTTLIYQSYKLISGIDFTDYLYNYGLAIYGNSNDGVLMYGSIEDVVLHMEGTHPVKGGELAMTIQNTTPETVVWKIKERYGLHIVGEPDFVIPTDIILTKQ